LRNTEFDYLSQLSDKVIQIITNYYKLSLFNSEIPSMIFSQFFPGMAYIDYLQRAGVEQHVQQDDHQK